MAKSKKKDQSEELANRIFEKMEAKNAVDEVNDPNELDTSTIDDVTDETNEEVDEMNIFDFCDNLIAEKKCQLKYEIRKNGEMLVSQWPPYSWEKLQKEHGGGHYQIIARNLETRTYIKKETRAVADLPHQEQERMIETQPTQTAPEPKMNFMEMFTMIRQAENDAKSEAREAAKESSSGTNMMMTSVLQMMQTSQQSTQQMIMEMNKQTQAMMEKMNDNTNRMMEKFTEKIEKVAEASKAKKEGIEPLQLITMLNQERNSGMDMMRTMMDLAEAKADERVAEVEERFESQGEKKKSMTESLVETILPTVANALANANQQPQQRQITQRRALPPATTSQTGQPRTGTSGHTIQAPNAQGVSNQNKSGSQVHESRGSNSGKSIISPSTEIIKGLTKTQKSKAIEPTVVQEESIQDHLEAVVFPALTQSLILNATIEESKALVIKELNKAEVPMTFFLQNYKKADILKAVTKYNIPKDSQEKLLTLYAYLETSNRTALSGEPVKG